MNMRFETPEFEGFRQGVISILETAVTNARTQVRSIGSVQLSRSMSAETAKLNEALSRTGDAVDYLERMTESFDTRLRTAANTYAAAESHTTETYRRLRGDVR